MILERKQARLLFRSFCQIIVSSKAFFSSKPVLWPNIGTFLSFLVSFLSFHCRPFLAQIVFSTMRILILKGAESPNGSNTDATKENIARWVILIGSICQPSYRVPACHYLHSIACPEGMKWGLYSKTFFLVL